MNKEGMMFKTYLEKEYGIKVEISDSGWEAVTLYHEELDPDVFPTEILTTLPDPLLFLTSSFDDSEGNEWIFCLVTKNGDSSIWLSAFCLKNGKLFAKNIPLQN